MKLIQRQKENSQFGVVEGFLNIKMNYKNHKEKFKKF